ncbi:unnamed protein product [Paramecium sonneborni]|uniref:Uncharacterized protein n=1 Tax=Paramecium sonneborni TaxID=65129 RepID=A0A8S1PHR9_9CILI|nr:unnamed protein product [Paramecium sonneborni]
MEPLSQTNNHNFPKLILNGNIELIQYIDQETFQQLPKPKPKYSRIAQLPNNFKQLKSTSLLHSLLL